VADVDALVVHDPERVCYLTQTTLSLDETRDIVIRLKERFPLIQGPPAQDICYATENRQMAVKAVASFCDLLLVVGSQNSSNSKRLVEVGDNTGVRSFLVNDWDDVDEQWLSGVKNVAVTAGASAPEHLVNELMASLKEHGFHQLEEVELVEEDVRFSLPGELAHAASVLTTISTR
jgi:4-hydroxy-3-methylbut-2-enyl diphosphate reductase